MSRNVRELGELTFMVGPKTGTRDRLGRGLLPEGVAELAVLGGASAVLLEKDGVAVTASRLRSTLGRYWFPQNRRPLIVVRDDLAAAVDIQGDGFLMEQNGATPAAVRRVVGEDMLLGVTARTPNQAIHAPEVVDYLFVDLFSHPPPRKGGSIVDVFERIVEAAGDIPVIATIDTDTVDAEAAARLAINAGAKGIASGAPEKEKDGDIKLAAHRLRQIARDYK